MTLEEASERIGGKVVYRAPHLHSDQPGEEGIITSVNDRWVFVRYGSRACSAATAAELLIPVTIGQKA